MNEPPPATEEEDFPTRCRRIAASLRRNARAAPDAETQRFALARADELEATALRHERVGAALDGIEGKISEADRLRGLAEEMVTAARKDLHALHLEMLPKDATRQ